MLFMHGMYFDQSLKRNGDCSRSRRGGVDRGLASLCWRCPGLRLHITQWVHLLAHPQHSVAEHEPENIGRQFGKHVPIGAHDSQHENMKIPTNIQTYKSRVWTRAEQVSFSTKSCASKMFTMTTDFGEVPESWMADLAALLEGAPATRRA